MQPLNPRGSARCWETAQCRLARILALKIADGGDFAVTATRRGWSSPAGVFDVINDFGASAGNFDYLRFEGIHPARLTYTDVGSSLVISTHHLGGSGGIIISNFSAALLGDHLIFA
ncbi:hypothetical protein [Bosea sp. LjRoot237]|uniref:hypothetical protein n=1 Tax=Bosea sp. LjRoot237 TaxID=3342292 RepID=UPI003ED0231A